ncbi:hypothetical protein, partial [Thalassolituus marinus]|uniref:hypothetical protein n=1 Tax=Thalassolituus marinus TaxID=671053 RepID=UPI001CE31856
STPLYGITLFVGATFGWCDTRRDRSQRQLLQHGSQRASHRDGSSCNTSLTIKVYGKLRYLAFILGYFLLSLTDNLIHGVRR